MFSSSSSSSSCTPVVHLALPEALPDASSRSHSTIPIDESMVRCLPILEPTRLGEAMWSVAMCLTGPQRGSIARFSEFILSSMYRGGRLSPEELVANFYESEAAATAAAIIQEFSSLGETGESFIQNSVENRRNGMTWQENLAALQGSF